MLVCKFEINWSTNKNLRALTTYLGRTDGLTGAGDNKWSIQTSFQLKLSQVTSQKMYKL